MSQVMKVAAANIKKGLQIGGFDIEGIIQQNIFEGISNKLIKKDGNNEKLEIQQITKIVSKPQFQDIYNEGIK